MPSHKLFAHYLLPLLSATMALAGLFFATAGRKLNLRNRLSRHCRSGPTRPNRLRTRVSKAPHSSMCPLPPK
jgi:hypothetical protein